MKNELPEGIKTISLSEIKEKLKDDRKPTYNITFKTEDDFARANYLIDVGIEFESIVKRLDKGEPTDGLLSELTERVREHVSMDSSEKTECSYCSVTLSDLTPASPRRKYKYCPMCGEELNWEYLNSKNRKEQII